MTGRVVGNTRRIIPRPEQGYSRAAMKKIVHAGGVTLNLVQQWVSPDISPRN